MAVSNSYMIPDRGRSVVTPDGNLYMVGGYLPTIKSFLGNTFTLDEHRSQLVALQSMHRARADHALHIEGDKIYVFGGMAFNEDESHTRSLNSVEVYDISEDKWTELEPFVHER